MCVPTRGHRGNTMGEHSRKATVNESQFSLLLSGAEMWRAARGWGELQGLGLRPVSVPSMLVHTCHYNKESPDLDTLRANFSFRP